MVSGIHPCFHFENDVQQYGRRVKRVRLLLLLLLRWYGSGQQPLPLMNGLESHLNG